MKDIVNQLREKTGDPEGDFHKSFMVDIEMGSMKSEYVIDFMYRKQKPNGEFTKKQYKFPCIMNYNPFTGEKL